MPVSSKAHPWRWIGHQLGRWPGTILAALLALAWLVWCPPTADLSAQFYRAHLFSVHGWLLWNNYWYGGHYLLGYSVLFGPLAAFVGVKLLGVIAVVATAMAADWLFYSFYGSEGRLAAAWLGVGLTSELLSGEITFALGLAGVGACAAALNGLLRYSKPNSGIRTPLFVGVAAGAAFAALASPVAALFAGMIGVALLIGGPRGRLSAIAGCVTAGFALLPALALSIAFPQGGQQPFTTESLVPLLIAGVILLLLLRGQFLLKTTLVLYLIGCIAAAISTLPIGSNASRLGELTFGPLFALALYPQRRHWRWAIVALVILAVPLLRIQWQYPFDDLQQAVADGHHNEAYYTPLVNYLKTRPGAGRGAFRVEIPFTEQHWETDFVARSIPLARGWERQLDVQDDSLFYKHKQLNATTYRAWLDSLAVRYVAVADARPDYSARAELKLIDRGLPYLKLVARLPHWRVYEVRDPAPMVSGGATFTRLGVDSVRLHFDRPGVASVQVRYSPYWQIDGISGCVTKSGPFVSVLARAAGTATLRMAFALNRVGKTSERCR